MGPTFGRKKIIVVITLFLLTGMIAFWETEYQPAKRGELLANHLPMLRDGKTLE